MEIKAAHKGTGFLPKRSNKRNVPNWEKLQWNCGETWAIPLPEYPVDGVFIQDRWFIPDEYPVIPTGWIYRLAREEIICEFQLYCRLQVPEPDVDDSLPGWADYYSNESDYWIAEHPEAIH